MIDHNGRKIPALVALNQVQPPSGASVGNTNERRKWYWKRPQQRLPLSVCSSQFPLPDISPRNFRLPIFPALDRSRLPSTKPILSPCTCDCHTSWLAHQATPHTRTNTQTKSPVFFLLPWKKFKFPLEWIRMSVGDTFDAELLRDSISEWKSLNLVSSTPNHPQVRFFFFPTSGMHFWDLLGLSKHFFRTPFKVPGWRFFRLFLCDHLLMAGSTTIITSILLPHTHIHTHNKLQSTEIRQKTHSKSAGSVCVCVCVFVWFDKKKKMKKLLMMKKWIERRYLIPGSRWRQQLNAFSR